MNSLKIEIEYVFDGVVQDLQQVAESTATAIENQFHNIGLTGYDEKAGVRVIYLKAPDIHYKHTMVI